MEIRSRTSAPTLRASMEGIGYWVGLFASFKVVMLIVAELG